MVIMAYKGYVLSTHTKELIEADLNTYVTTVHDLMCVGKPISLIAHQVGKRDMLYSVDAEHECICYQNVDDLPCMSLWTIPVGKNPQPMQVYEGVGYVVNQGSGSVSIIDLYRNQSIEIMVGKGPSALNFYRDYGFVSCQEDQKVVVLDLTTNTIVKEIPTKSSPFYLTLDKNKGCIVTHNECLITVFDLGTLKLV